MRHLPIPPWRRYALLSPALLLPLLACGQDAGVAAATTAAPASMTNASSADTAPRLPANTVVELETVDPVSSHSSRPGDLFRLRVARDVLAGGVVVIPAGTPATGQVVHAAKAGMGGKSGELILAARYLDLPQGRVVLRSGFGAAGKDRTGAAMATTLVVGVLGLLVKGRELELPAGSPLSARLATTTTFTSAP